MSSTTVRTGLPETVDGFVGFLERHGAQNDLVEWVRRGAVTGADFVERCPRADWLVAVWLRAGHDPSHARQALAEALPGALLSTDHAPTRALIERVAHAIASTVASVEPLRREVEAARAWAPSMTETFILEALDRALDVVAEDADVAEAVPIALAALVEVAAVEVLDCGSDAALREARHRAAEATRRALASVAATATDLSR